MNIIESNVGVSKQSKIGLLVAFIALIAFLCLPSLVQAGMRSVPPKVIDAVMIGDRLVDISYHLGVLPKGMSVRGSMWPMARKLKVSSQILGCPNYTTVKKKETIPNFMAKHGLTRLIVEKSPAFCLYKKKVDPPKSVAEIMKGKNVTIEYVDFSKGVPSAIEQTAALLGCPDKAAPLVKKYQKAMAKAEKALPKEKSGKKVVIFCGTYQPGTGKYMLRVEAPKGYADQFLLQPLGLVNAGKAFAPKDGKPAKGHFTVKKSRKGLNLAALVKANPDYIVLTGDAFAGQKGIADYAKAHPELNQVPAIRNNAVFALPCYYDSSLLEYPAILSKWASALKD